MIDYTTIVGGLPRDPEMRFTPNGRAVTEFTVAQSDAKKNEQGQWEKTTELYIDVNIWNADRGQNPVPWAEIAATLKKGDQVAVHGKLRTRSWQDQDGNKRSKIDFAADRIYLLMRDEGNGPAPQQNNGGWGNQQPQGNQWGNPTPAGGGENPPF